MIAREKYVTLSLCLELVSSHCPVAGKHPASSLCGVSLVAGHLHSNSITINQVDFLEQLVAGNLNPGFESFKLWITGTQFATI